LKTQQVALEASSGPSPVGVGGLIESPTSSPLVKVKHKGEYDYEQRGAIDEGKGMSAPTATCQLPMLRRRDGSPAIM